MVKARTSLALLGLTAGWSALLLLAGCGGPGTEGRCTSASPPVELTQPTAWGRGPTFSQQLQLTKAHPEPVYLTGMAVRVVDARGQSVEAGPALDWWEVAWANPERHGEVIGRSAMDSPTLIRMSGETRLVNFPEGHGLPMFSNEPLCFRGGWSGGTAASGEACKVELDLIYQRARELEQPLTPVRMMAAWAGPPADPKDPRSWLLGPDEPIRGTYKLADDASVLAQHWLKGPGVGQVTLDRADGGEVSIVTFRSTDEPATRPTALGVNLVLLDTEWPGWK